MKQRIVTGVLAGSLYLALLLIGSIPFALLCTAIAVICFMELAAMKKFRPYSAEVLISAACVAAVVLDALFQREAPFTAHFVRILLILVLLLMSGLVFSTHRFHFDRAAHLILSVFYISFSFYLLVMLRFESLVLILFVQITIWATDSGAYFIGRKWGRHKLSPSISPNKTKEGAIGAVAVALIAAIVFQMIVRDPFFSSWQKLVSVTLIISVLGQLGDLVESAIKRSFGVKDSGSILPGHGGLFDRFDSLIFVLPILYLIGVIG
ncbi:phosphatidate cytidylyltransferase [Sporolactobacillus sp. THM7-4]|nr:phosphatidate cytidylyltransferase [Sporolactobacillus sp. THM7-4]